MVQEKTPKKMTMKFETVTHIDVRGKEQFFLKLSNQGKEHLINIGKTTFEKINALLDAEGR